MIYITVSGKGGVGKSTFSNQILSSYLYLKNNKKINLVEIDDENNDNATFSKTEIMNCQIIPTNKIKMMDEIFFSNEDTIIDVGGNKTASIFLDEMKKVKEFENIVWFIPLGSGEQDNLNALETYNEIKMMDEKAKIIFVLSRANNLNDLEWEFLNFFGNEHLNTKFAICNQIKNVEYLVIKSSADLNNARYFQKTVFDLSLNETDFRARAKEETDSKKRSKLIFMNRTKNTAIEYCKYLQDEVFPVLNNILK